MTTLEKIISDELKSGLEITLIDERGELYARVSWIDWDSGFRDSGLRIEDRIVALNGAQLTLPDEPAARRNARDRVIGGLQESTTFAQMGLSDGSRLTLTVLRRSVPGRGWDKLDITGSVRAERAYFDGEGKPALGPGGPARLARNDIGDTWMSWYERRVFDWERILDGRWLGKFDSRRELASHLQMNDQIDATQKGYPGTFAKRLSEDFEAVAESLRGRAVTLPADALAFREQSDVVKKEIATVGDGAWTAFLANHQAVETLPRLDLIRDDRTPLAGKVVALPGIDWSAAVTEGDRSVFVSSHSDYPCFIAADQPAMRTFWKCQADYQARVEPRVPEKYDVIGRISPDTRLVVTPRGAKIGLDIEVVAVRVPGHFFADVTGAAPTFEGAERASARGAAMPADDASKGDVMRAYVAAVKAGDEKVWLALYADWVAMAGEGRPLYRPFDRYKNYLSDYTRARNLMLHKVSHVEPVWEGDSRVILKGDEFPGAPKIEEADVLVDHISRFDEADRVFCTIELTRLWQLQRVDGGPWRIASRNVL